MTKTTSSDPRTSIPAGFAVHRPLFRGDAPEDLDVARIAETKYWSPSGYAWVPAMLPAWADDWDYMYPVAMPAAACASSEALYLPDDDAVRGEFPMFDGLIAYFPNALAEVSRVSKIGNDQHNPGQPMHWARDKSTDHENKIARHLVDRGKRDGRGVRHSARLAWRALAMLQEEIERDEGLPPSPASHNRPW